MTLLLAAGLVSLAALAPPPARAAGGRAAGLTDRRALIGAALAAAVLPSAPAFADEVEMSELRSRNIDCPKRFFLPAKGRWQCIEVTADANNIGKKDLGAAGVFGRVRDRDGYPCLATALDDKMRTEIATIYDVPRGKSTVSFILATDATAPRPLEFEGFRASRKDKGMEKLYAPFSECDLDPVGCVLGDVPAD